MLTNGISQIKNNPINMINMEEYSLILLCILFYFFENTVHWLKLSSNTVAARFVKLYAYKLKEEYNSNHA